jgi:hypothetical protein
VADPPLTSNPVSPLSLPDAATSSSALCSDAITINPDILAISTASESLMGLSTTAVAEVSAKSSSNLEGENLSRGEELPLPPENALNVEAFDSDSGDNLSILRAHISRALEQVPQQVFLEENPLFHVRCEVGRGLLVLSSRELIYFHSEAANEQFMIE